MQLSNRPFWGQIICLVKASFFGIQDITDRAFLHHLVSFQLKRCLCPDFTVGELFDRGFIYLIHLLVFMYNQKTADHVSN